MSGGTYGQARGRDSQRLRRSAAELLGDQVFGPGFVKDETGRWVPNVAGAEINADGQIDLGPINARLASIEERLKRAGL